MNVPKISVIMAVYNGAEYLEKSIESILNQSYNDFELLIIDDGSTDSSPQIISNYKNDRIKCIRLDRNSGVANARNTGLNIAKGDFIAIMDCDDISNKDRLAFQIKFMTEHANVGVCGSDYYIVEKGKKYYVSLPHSNNEIRCFMLFNCAFAHSTVFIRSKILRDHNIRYSPEFLYAEDYQLLTRIGEYAQLTNIPKPLMLYRIHSEQTSNNPEKIEKQNCIYKIHLQQLKLLGIEPSEKDLFIHKLISDGKKPDSPDQIKEAENWLMRLLKTNRSEEIFNSDYLQKTILEKWLHTCYQSFGFLSGIKYFYKSSLYHEIKLPFQLKKDFILNLYYSFLRSSYFR